MPKRVPKPAILKVELLSSGIDPRLTDDWNGELLPQPNAKVPPGSEVFARARSTALAAKRAMILAPLLPKPVGKPFKRRV